jgi:hypothetical protein
VQTVGGFFLVSVHGVNQVADPFPNGDPRYGVIEVARADTRDEALRKARAWFDGMDGAVPIAPQEAERICEGCGHPWRFHTGGGMCQGTAKGIECYCALIPDADDLRPAARLPAEARPSPTEPNVPADKVLREGDARYARGIVRAHRMHNGTLGHTRPIDVEVLERILWRAGLYSGPVQIEESASPSPIDPPSQEGT